MHKIFTALKHWFASWLQPPSPDDPLVRMTASELADLPVHHPLCDPCGA